MSGGGTDYRETFARAAAVAGAVRGIDDEVYALDPRIVECVLHDYHSPLPWVLHRHHVILQSWTQALGMKDSRLIPVCPTGHDDLHLAIAAELAGVMPMRPIDEKVQPYVDEAVAFWQFHRERLDARAGRLGVWEQFTPFGIESREALHAETQEEGQVGQVRQGREPGQATGAPAEASSEDPR